MQLALFPFLLETPPRAWRRPEAHAWAMDKPRNTSTSVEKTSVVSSIININEKHLHERGEDRFHPTAPGAYRETPPRAWRRHGLALQIASASRNTSTSVEKTRVPSARSRSRQKHLHERGEDKSEYAKVREEMETPPRAWRRLTDMMIVTLSHRNTSTSVEKTNQRIISAVSLQKHLHERGEDREVKMPVKRWKETPPRAWRRLASFEKVFTKRRNTSTSVEKTKLWGNKIL